MKEIIHLLKFKFISFININKQLSKEPFWRNVASSLIFLTFAFGTFFFVKEIIRYVLEEIHIGEFLLHRFFSMILFVFFFSINAGNLIVAYSMVFKSKEIQFLMTKPVKYSNIFIIKILESILYSSPTFLMIGISALFAYGSYYKVDWFFYPFSVFFIFLPFVFIAALLGILMLFILIKIASKIGIRFTIGLTITFYIISLFTFFKAINPRFLVNEIMKYYPYLDFSFRFLDPIFTIYLPNYWFTESFYWYVKGKPEFALPYIMLMILSFLFFCIISILIADKFYYKAYLTIIDLATKKSDRSKKTKLLSFGKESHLNTQTEVLLKKEFWQFFREPGQWIHLAVILFLILIFISSIAKVNLLSTLPFLQVVTYTILFIFNAFLVSSITLRFLYPILSIEAESFWKIKSAPIDRNKLLQIKFLPWFFLTLIIAELLNFFSHIPISKYDVLLISSSINMLFVAITLSALNFGMGVYFVSFNEKSPVKIASSRGATIAFLFNMIYLIFLVTILFFPLNEYFNKFLSDEKINYFHFFISSLILGVVSIISISIMKKIFTNTVKKDF